MAHGEFLHHQWTPQELQNRGFDPTFEVAAVEMLGYDSGSNVLRRIAVDASGNIAGSSTSNLVSPDETGNSSIVPLGISGVFTGTWTDVSAYQSISIQIRTDKGSASNGLSVQMSPDGVNADTPYVVTVSADQEKTIIRPVTNKYFRVVYTNGVLAQTFMRLQTIYHVTAPGPMMIDTLGDYKETLTPRMLTRNDNMLYTATGAWNRQRDLAGSTPAFDKDGSGIVASGLVAQFDDASTATVTENQYAPVRISSRRALLVEGVASGTPQSVSIDQTTPGTTNAVTDVAATTGGWTTFHLVSAATTNATVVKASAGQLGGYYIYNSNAAARKLVFHNASSTPTAGASVYFSIMIPAGSAANVEFGKGIPFSTGISITTVTGIADSDSAAVAANDLIINLFYK